MSIGGDSILEAFLYETNSLLEQLDSIVLEAEQKNDFSDDDVSSIFRIMHTIKGASAMMEYDPIAKVAHRVEDMYAIIREKSMVVVPLNMREDLFDLLFLSVDFFRSQVEKIEQSQPLDTDIDHILIKVNALIDGINGGTGDNVATSLQTSTSSSDSGYSHSITLYFEEGSGMENLRAYMITNSIKEICDTQDFSYFPADVDSNPSSSEIIVDQGFTISFKNKSDMDNAIQIVANAGAVKSFDVNDVATAEPVPAPAPVVEETPAVSETPKPVEESKPVAQKPAPAKDASKVEAPHVKESFISVNLSKLDQLQAVVGEIVITESMVTSSPDLKHLKLDAFTKSARQLRKLTDELQDVSMSLRMIPVSATFQKMNRIVRDMSKKLNKQVKLTLLGEDTEIDKTIVDSIGDPIMHIIRNSMDHGIETSVDDRIANGKTPGAEIVLSAHHTGSEVIIQIKDDGKGVNYENVLNKAIKNGLASPDVEYSEKEILNFLLTAGFSTNAQVTEFSGRGVGMDVVKQNIESVGGTIVITSVQGQGMTTTLKIPLTMAIMDGMEVSVGASTFTIPIQHIKQTFRVSSSEILSDANGGEIFKLGTSYYPIIRMSNTFSIDGGFEKIEDGILIWLDTGEFSYCLFVDELLGEQQVVVKPLPSYLNSFNIKKSGIVGCTILGDGNISIILDVVSLYSRL